jgi:hypothetical protein
MAQVVDHLLSKLEALSSAPIEKKGKQIKYVFYMLKYPKDIKKKEVSILGKKCKLDDLRLFLGFDMGCLSSTL